MLESADFDAETVEWLVLPLGTSSSCRAEKIPQRVKVRITRDQSGESAQLMELNQNFALRKFR